MDFLRKMCYAVGPMNRFGALPITQADLDSLAAARGETNPGKPWVLTPFDTWEPNPYYDGSKGPFESIPHPESDEH